MSTNYENKTVAELRVIAQKMGVKNVKKFPKAELLKMITKSQSPTSRKTPTTSKPPTTSSSEDKDLRTSVVASDSRVRVSCGASSDYFPVLGKKIEFIRLKLREILNIAAEADAVVNGKKVPEDYVILNGDSVEFIRTAGRKGRKRSER